jgi:hypothetical protein
MKTKNLTISFMSNEYADWMIHFISNLLNLEIIYNLLINKRLTQGKQEYFNVIGLDELRNSSKIENWIPSYSVSYQNCTGNLPSDRMPSKTGVTDIPTSRFNFLATCRGFTLIYHPRVLVLKTCLVVLSN